MKVKNTKITSDAHQRRDKLQNFYYPIVVDTYRGEKNKQGVISMPP